MMKEMDIITPITGMEVDLLYSGNKMEDKCIGHLRGDFGSAGDGFWTTWFDHHPEIKTQAFKDELVSVILSLREHDHILHSLRTMGKLCGKGYEIRDYDFSSYGFKHETDDYMYYLRCKPVRGDYNFYLYCYAK